jgi:hypothetical protein
MYGLGAGGNNQQCGGFWRYGTVGGLHVPVGGKYDLEFVGLYGDQWGYGYYVHAGTGGECDDLLPPQGDEFGPRRILQCTDLHGQCVADGDGDGFADLGNFWRAEHLDGIRGIDLQLVSFGGLVGYHGQFGGGDGECADDLHGHRYGRQWLCEYGDGDGQCAAVVGGHHQR